ncbi:hypothetical protein BJX61DRAFT_283392 [Aspergillus egyptiacus]|nr:hypothetical protein BJX61DRAFT_283392 [Aspergillus egyptiacus]
MCSMPSFVNIRALHSQPGGHSTQSLNCSFWKELRPELFSAKNGLLVSRAVENWLNSGKFLIVPDLPERPEAPSRSFWLGFVAKYATIKPKLSIPLGSSLTGASHGPMYNILGETSMLNVSSSEMITVRQRGTCIFIIALKCFAKPGHITQMVARTAP